MENDKITQLISRSKENSNKFAPDSMSNYRIVCEDYLKLYHCRRNIEASLKSLLSNKRPFLFNWAPKAKAKKIEESKLLIQEIFKAEEFLMNHIWKNWTKIKTSYGIEEATIYAPNMANVHFLINNLLQKNNYTFDTTLHVISKTLMIRKKWYWINKFEPLRIENEKSLTEISSSDLFDIYQKNLEKIYERHQLEKKVDPRSKKNLQKTKEDIETLTSIYSEYFQLPFHTNQFTFNQIYAFAEKNININHSTQLHKHIAEYLTNAKQRVYFLNYTIVLSEHHNEIFNIKKIIYYENLSAIMEYQAGWSTSCTKDYYIAKKRTNNDLNDIAITHSIELRELQKAFKNNINKQFIQNILNHNT